jgi:GNAT superfamily N-acetyltransferase
MDEAELAVAADKNLAVTWAALGRAMGADVVELGPSALVATGLPIAFFNGAFVGASPPDPQQVVNESIRFFGERGLSWLLWVRDGVSPATLEAGRAAGLRDAGGPPAMGLATIRPAPSPPAELTIDIATTAADVADHASMLRDGFGMPQEFVDRLIQPPLLDQSSMAVFVGRVDDAPVSCSLLSMTDATAGVYNVATPAAFRGKGYGEALTWAAVSEGARRGCTNAILQASEAGYPIYRRMGFVDLGRYVQLEGPPSTTAG